MTTRPASTDDLRFLNQFAKVEHSENRLPHGQQPGATFFVTFRLFSLIENHPLEDLLQSGKGYTAHEINKRLNRQGPLWMKDYFDRMIRDSRHFWRCARYIRRNPEKARLNNREFSLHEAPFVKNVLDSEMGNLGRSGVFPGAGEDQSPPGRLESRPSGT